MQDKLLALKDLLQSLDTVAVGFSGGVDSTFLAAACARYIPQRTHLIHLDSPFVGTPEQEFFAKAIDQLGLPVTCVSLDPLADPKVAANPCDRCYHCKLAGFSHIVETARSLGAYCVLEGSNADDAQDYRPGMRAVRELGVRSPLMETGWHKDQERQMLRQWGFSVWNLPAGACLATRVACGQRLTLQLIQTIRRCEDLLHAYGLVQVRARVSGRSLRIDACDQDLALLESLGGARLGDDRVVLPARIEARLRATTLAPSAASSAASPATSPAAPSAASLDDDPPIDHVDPLVHAYRKGAMNNMQP